MGLIRDASLFLRGSDYSGSGAWLDLSGNGNDATIVGSPTFADGVFTLNGSTQFMLVSDDDTLDVGAEQELTAIFVGSIDETNPGAAQIALSKFTAGPGWYMQVIGAGNETVAMQLNDTSNAPFDLTGNLTDGVEYSLAFVRDGTNVEAFVDGVSSGSPATDSTWGQTLASSADVYIGAYSGGQLLAGTVRGVGIWRSALTAAQISAATSLLGKDPIDLHGDALMSWILANETLTNADTELVGALNELNGTNGVEYAQARATYLGVDPAG